VIVHRAAWVLPIARPPIRDGWVAVDAGRIVDVGTGAHPPGDVHDLAQTALLPGLVNAHTHLELSYLRGQVPAADSFIAWIRGVMAARRQRPDPQAAEIVDGVRDGIDEAVRCGTAIVGDISNTLVTVGPLRDSALGGVVFYELIRFNAPDAEALVAEACRQIDSLPPARDSRPDAGRTAASTRRASQAPVVASLAAHAPYSVSPQVFRAIRTAVEPRAGLPVSVHLCEGREEIELLATGQGAWRAFLQEVGSWDPAWVPPGCTPVAFLDGSGFLDGRVLAVHGVQMTAADLARLAARGTTVVTCPRSNRYTGAGDPPIEDFYASGVRVAVGTDSLASTPDLNVFAELASMRALAPSVPAGRLLASATIEGAAALGFAGDYGTLERGKTARVLGVRVPAAVGDVEEYLVSGIAPEQLRWIS
jgi:cytosine/adenosine deaminase-related metal-dependent hydrolase